MNNFKNKKATIKLINTMVDYAKKGTSDLGTDEREKKKKASSHLAERFVDQNDIIKLIEAYYGDNILVLSEYGCISFSPDGMSDLVGGSKLSYDDYLEIQIKSGRNVKRSFQKCYYEMPMGFMGEVERKGKGKILFKRIFVDGMYKDGELFEGKEDHVWMDEKGFEAYDEGDCVSFFTEIYRCVKTGNGKFIDYGLRNPEDIKKIDGYELPTDEGLCRQIITQIICETCYLRDHCYNNCLLPKGARRQKVDALMKQFINGM